MIGYLIIVMMYVDFISSPHLLVMMEDFMRHKPSKFSGFYDDFMWQMRSTGGWACNS